MGRQYRAVFSRPPTILGPTPDEHGPTRSSYEKAASDFPDRSEEKPGWELKGIESREVSEWSLPVVPKPSEPPTLDAPEGYVRVVTRYGGSQHLARADGNIGARHFAACTGTSAWTLESWAENPDHPTLRPDEIPKLPPCRRCAQVAPKP